MVRWWSRYLVMLSLLASTSAAAQAPEPDAPSAEKLESAKELFKRGVALFQAGDIEHALDHFLRSRAAFASSKNTINAAICLDKLGRYDEALEMYEEALTRFASELDEKDRASIAPQVARLRGLVGSVVVSANVEGSLVIDGRPRGKLPLATSIRLVAGKHVMRVLKDGYATHEVTIEVKTGETLKIDARLEPLAQAGQLRVEDPTNDGAELFVDRAQVGTVPWEGTLGPGRHVVWTRKGERGSAPTAALVVQGQTILVRLRSEQLGPTSRIEVAPRTAEISIDGVTLGPGEWEGRLPIGPHVAAASEPGFETKSVRFVVGADTAPTDLRISLPVDAAHPRWPKPARLQFTLEAYAGFALGSTLGARAEECDECVRTRATGPIAGARFGVRFPIGLSIELGLGYLYLGARVQRGFDQRLPTDDVARFTVDDELSVRGPFIAAGVRQELALGARVVLFVRVGLAVLLAASRDGARATVTSGGETASASIVASGRTVRSTGVLVLPELGLHLRVGAWHLGPSLALATMLTAGPPLETGQINPPLGGCDTARPNGPGCVVGSEAIASERAYGTFALFVPQLSAGLTF